MFHIELIEQTKERLEHDWYISASGCHSQQFLSWSTKLQIQSDNLSSDTIKQILRGEMAQSAISALHHLQELLQMQPNETVEAR